MAVVITKIRPCPDFEPRLSQKMPIDSYCAQNNVLHRVELCLQESSVSAVRRIYD